VFCQLVDSLGKEITQTDLVPVFVKLLKDSEAEVRTAASRQVTGVCKLVQLDTVVKVILPVVLALATDEAQSVRAALATDVLGLAPLFGAENTRQHLLDLYLLLLKDDFPEVRLNVIGKLNMLVTSVIGLEHISQHLLAALQELAEDRQWRIRLAIIEYIPLLAQQLGVEFFNSKLCGLCLGWLSDCVYAIRKAATQNLYKLTVVFGTAWAQTHIFPKIKELMKSTNYLYRVTPLSAVAILAPAFTQAEVATHLLPLVLECTQDPIANIRLNACKTAAKLIPSLEASITTASVKPGLTKLLDDKDNDVRHFANLAVLACK